MNSFKETLSFVSTYQWEALEKEANDNYVDTDCGNRPNSPLYTLVATVTVSQTGISLDTSVFDNSVDV